MRPTRHQTFMEIAQVISKRATCMRLNVGAVIVRDSTVVSHGYNGHDPGSAHCSGNDCPGRDRCTLTTHAEINAVRRLKRLPGERFDIYVTDSPCEACLSVLETMGVFDRLFFANPYRITKHLQGSSIPVYRILPAGYIMDWTTRKVVEFEK